MFDDDEGDFVVIDVREPEEFQDWRIAGSFNIPLGDEFASRVKSVARQTPIVTVCRTGVRSLYAVGELQDVGVTARSLRGGMVAWSNTYVYRSVPLSPASTAKVFQVRRQSKGCTSYVIADGNECTVVDPTSRIDEYTKIATKNGLRITNVVDTHKHADHISGSKILSSETGANLHLSGLDGYEFEGYRKILNGTRIPVGKNGMEIESIHTPGHTPGGMSLLLDDQVLFSGDTLLLDGVGRPDLHGSPEASARQLYRSCQRIFERLEPETLVLPAHFGQQTDLMALEPLVERILTLQSKVGQTNLSDEVSVNALVSNLPKPANYETILKINSRADSLDKSICDLLEEGPNRCSLSRATIGDEA